MTLKDKAIKGVKWTGVSSVIGATTQLLQLVVLAHYLSPEDFGLMALALVVVGFSQMFLDMGVSNAIIHKQKITKKELDTLYIINIFSGFIISTSLFILSPLLANFYNEPKLEPIIKWISISFIIQPFGQQFLVLLKKELKFNEIAKRDVISKITSLLIAVLLAVNGYGVYSLVFANLSAALLSTSLLLYIGLKYHRPSFYFNFSLARQSLRFGLFQMGENFVNYFNTQIDSILIGKLLGVEVLGIYDIAKNLARRPAQIINPIITQITFPLLATMQNDIRGIKSIYLRTINYLASINFPIYIFIAVFAEPLVVVLFGAQWIDAVPILQVLSIYGMIRSTGNPVGALILARGRADLGFYWNLGLFFLIPISIYFGSSFGIMGITFTLLALQLSLQVPSWLLLVKKCCNAGFYEYFSQFTRPLWIATLQAVSYLSLIYSLKDPILLLVAGGGTLVITGILLNKVFNKIFFNELLSSFYSKGVKKWV